MHTARRFVISIIVVMVCAFAMTAFLPTEAHAQAPTCAEGKFCPLANVEGSKLGTLYSSTTSLAGFISTLFYFAISAGAILAVLRLSWAGYLYMTSDSWGSKGHAREVIGEVVLGLLLLLGAWLILYQINPDILKLNFLETLKEKIPKTVTPPTPETGYF